METIRQICQLGQWYGFLPPKCQKNYFPLEVEKNSIFTQSYMLVRLHEGGRCFLFVSIFFFFGNSRIKSQDLEPCRKILPCSKSIILASLLQLVDFESWKTILARAEKNSGSISSQGAICILPNALEGRHLDVQGNIYAFGILLLEIISGRPPYCKEKGCLVEWVRKVINFDQLLLDPSNSECMNCTWVVSPWHQCINVILHFYLKKKKL